MSYRRQNISNHYNRTEILPEIMEQQSSYFQFQIIDYL